MAPAYWSPFPILRYTAKCAGTSSRPVVVPTDGSAFCGDREFESHFLQRRVRRTPTRTGEVPSDLEVVRYWDLAATERLKLNRTRRSAPSSAATRTVANPGAGG